MTWTTRTLGEIARRAGGEVRTGPFGSQLHKRDYVDDLTATPVVMPKDMVDGRVDTASIARVDDRVVERLSSHALRTGDIVLGRRGEIGRRAWTSDTEDGWLCGTGSMRITINGSTEVRPRFLFYYLGLPQTIGWLQGHAVGATMSNLSAGVVQQLPVRYPPTAAQDAIVEVLDAIENLIENNQRRIAVLEEMARLLYREWFVHFRYPRHEDVELVDSDLGSIPEGWSHTCLADELELQRFNIKPFEHPHELFQHYSIPAFDDRSLPSLELGTEIRSGKYLLSGESVMVSKLNPRFLRVWRVDCSDHRRRAVASTEFLVLTNPDKWTLSFVYGLLTSTEFANRLATTAGGTSTSHQRVKPADVMNMTVVSPPIEIVQRYSGQTRPVLKLADNLLEQVEVLRKARYLLLPRLVSGDLDLSELDFRLAAM